MLLVIVMYFITALLFILFAFISVCWIIVQMPVSMIQRTSIKLDINTEEYWIEFISLLKDDFIN